MKYEDLKKEIIALGFEEQSILNEYPEQFRTAITRALKVIATTVKAPVGEIVLKLSDEEERNETGRYDLWELSKDDNGNVLFDSIERVTTGDTTVKTFGAFDILSDHILSVDPQLEEDLTVYYNMRILPITDATQDDYELPVFYACEPLIALLAAHYVWLDDDERKAILYWNEYDSLKQEILGKLNAPKARIVRGLRW